MVAHSGIRDAHRRGFEELNQFWEELDAAEMVVLDQLETAPAYAVDRLERIADRIRAFEPTISVIGQIKAGKSTLLNALIGETDLLPADVNPWTSVITALHLNSRTRPENTRALFRFFDAEEWDRLVETGGRLGEMAARAGFGSEVEEVREQVKEMRRTTEERLGAEFHELLGQSRAFPEIDKTTLDRFICYGDPEEMEAGSTEGVYADLTKLADLYIDLPDYPKGICFRDTPGVNDTFMMREQITLNAISESRICIIVLSAHQAMSTMDLALLRIICSVESREVLIFVNRIDELADPLNDMAKIERDIRLTLTRQGLGLDLPILFGSGYWANCALDDRCGRMMPMSRASLMALYPDHDLSDPETLRAMAMEGSGIGALHRAVAERIVAGPGQLLVADIRTDLAQIAEMRDTIQGISRDRAVQGGAMDTAAVRDRLQALGSGTLSDFDAQSLETRAQLQERLEAVTQLFVDTAVEALQSHIDAFGEVDNWSHEPSTLRMMMRSAYSTAVGRLRKIGTKSLEDIVDGIHDILEMDLNVFHDSMAVEFPQQPQHRPPTALAKTLSLDLHVGWWRKFWRFGSKNRAENRYRGLIEAEVAPLIEELLTEYYDEAARNTRDIVAEFYGDQRQFVDAILDTLGADAGARDAKERDAA